jgi:hypothetical protein
VQEQSQQIEDSIDEIKLKQNESLSKIAQSEEHQSIVMQIGKGCGLDFDNPGLIQESIQRQEMYQSLGKKLSILKLSAMSGQKRL